MKKPNAIKSLNVMYALNRFILKEAKVLRSKKNFYAIEMENVS